MIGGGLNAFVGNVHREAIGLDMRCKLAAGCFSRDAGINRDSGAAFGVEPHRVYPTYAELAAAEAQREDGVDFAVITVPNAAHYEIAKDLLRHGIHVVCEKPLCWEVGQAEELAALAAEKDLLFCVTYAYSGYCMMKFGRELILGGKIGDIINVTGEYYQEWLMDELGGGGAEVAKLAGWRDNPAVAGISNCVGDIGTHIEQTVAYMTGLKINKLAAKVHRFGQTLDMHANILVEYENGASGLYTCSQVCAGYQNALAVRIFGTLGAIEWQQENPDILKVTYKGQAPMYYQRGSSAITGRSTELKRIPGGHPEGYHIAFANTYQAYISALLKKLNGQELSGDDLDFPGIEAGIEGVKFLHAVIRSGDNGAAWEDVK